MTAKHAEQEETTRISVERIMATEAFRRGVRDARLGRVRFDEEASGLKWTPEIGPNVKV